MLEGLKRALFEPGEDEKKIAPQDPVPTPAATPPAVPTPFPSADGNNDFYVQLLAKTNFFTTKTGAIVSKYYEALMVLPDADLRLKTAIAQAKHLEKVTEADIQGAFNELAGILQAEANQFAQASSAFMKAEVTERQELIDNLGVELRRIQEQLSAETVKLAEAKGRMASTSSQFDSAVARRNSELVQETAKFLAASKG